MPIDQDFVAFLAQVRAGNEAAAAELVRRYLPILRREVRMRLHDPRLCRLLDSMDICQSVLASFFLRAAGGQFDLQHPRALLRLLVRMARNKLATHARKVRLSMAPETPEALDVVGGAPSPSQIVAGRDLLGAVLAHLTAEERRLAELRSAGLSWPAVASAEGGTAEARRKQMARAIERVVRQLHLDDL